MSEPAAPHLAQLNVAVIRYETDDPRMAGFMDALDEINAIADASPGFVWRLQSDSGNATDIRPDADNDQFLVNLSVWTDVESLRDYVYRSDHTPFLRRRAEWFERPDEAHLVLWHVPAGHVPSIDEALERLDRLRRDGPSEHAFTFAWARANSPDPSPSGQS